MSYSALANLFTYIHPFRSTLLKILPPFDIAKLSVTIDCELSTWEREQYMDVLDDILEDNHDLALMEKWSLSVRIFGSDLNVIERRLRDPRGYLAKFGRDYPLYIFFIVTSGTEHGDRLLQDFHQPIDSDAVSDEMDINETSQSFTPAAATSIATLSKWILCAPHLLGSLSIRIPGWVPVFNSRECVNIRAYIPPSMAATQEL